MDKNYWAKYKWYSESKNQVQENGDKTYWEKYKWHSGNKRQAIKKERLKEIKIIKDAEDKENAKAAMLLAIKEAIEDFKKDEKSLVISQRDYDISTDYKKTENLTLTGKNFGLSKERVRQIVNIISGKPEKFRRSIKIKNFTN